jgi:DNA-binding MarR family transcriptional regulator
VTRTSVAPAAVGNVGFLLAKASQRLNELLAEQFAAQGYGDVRPSYGSVLVPLFEANGLRLGELAASSRLSKQSITGLVRRCEQAGLVVRERDPDDGRAYQVRLTERGAQFRSVAEVVLGEIDEELRRSLGTRNHEALKAALRGVMDL